MTSRLFKIMLLSFSAALLGGCKLLVFSPPGGDVKYGPFGTFYTCAGGAVCEIEIDDANYTESFTAFPRPGYEFVRWVDAQGYRCGGSTSPTCTITLAGDALAQAAVDTYEIINIAPVYRDVGIDTDSDGVRNEDDEDDDNDGVFDLDDLCPLIAGGLSNGCNELMDFVVIDTVDWAQVDLFDGLSWDEMNAACPGGECTGQLNGFYMGGWQWADVDDMNYLFGLYIPDGSSIGPGPDNIYLPTEWLDPFFAEGWRPTREYFVLREGYRQEIRGLMSDGFAGVPDNGAWAEADGCQSPTCLLGADTARTDRGQPKYLPASGGWFYRK